MYVISALKWVSLSAPKTGCLPEKKYNPQMIIAALDFGSAAICNTDYLEVYDAFLSGGSGDGGGSTASRRLITRYCGNVSIIFSHQ